MEMRRGLNIALAVLQIAAPKDKIYFIHSYAAQAVLRLVEADKPSEFVKLVLLRQTNLTRFLSLHFAKNCYLLALGSFHIFCLSTLTFAICKEVKLIRKG
jgi:hypothetical protein